MSSAGGGFPRWRKDGRELFYMAPGNTITVAAVSAAGSAFQVGALTPLFKIDPPSNAGYPYASTPDGQRFLVNTNVAPPTPTMVVVNWIETLKKQ